LNDNDRITRTKKNELLTKTPKQLQLTKNSHLKFSEKNESEKKMDFRKNTTSEEKNWTKMRFQKKKLKNIGKKWLFAPGVHFFSNCHKLSQEFIFFPNVTGVHFFFRIVTGVHFFSSPNVTGVHCFSSNCHRSSFFFQLSQKSIFPSIVTGVHCDWSKQSFFFLKRFLARVHFFSSW